jgi:serine protease Do
VRDLIKARIAAWLILCFGAMQYGYAQSRADDPLDSAIVLMKPALVRLHVVAVYDDQGREQKHESAGSGVIITPEGHVITNHHVAGNAKRIVCTLANKEEIEAELVGTDPLADIAVVKLRPEQKRDFPYAFFGDSDKLQVGDPIYAMGSPLALSQSVTKGIISNTEMVMPEMFWPFQFRLEGEDVGSIVRWIGHDASIFPGNSGGPLVDVYGHIIGINEISFGIAGAIPGNLAKKIAFELIEKGSVARAWFGLEIQPLLKLGDTDEGALVSGTR